MKSRFALSRRTFLRGALGTAAVALALPPLEAMLSSNGDALADGKPLPKRFLLWFFGNGVRLERWVPAAQGAGYELSEALAPLANVKDYCSVLSGFYDPVGFGYPPHHCVGGILSGHPLTVLSAEGQISTKFGGPSIDQLIASQIGNDTYLPSLSVGVSKRLIATEGPTLSALSHKSPDQPIAPERSPLEVYLKLIGITSQPDRPAVLRAGVLDAVSADLKRLQGRVGKADKDRLEAHVESVGLLEKQLLAKKLQCEGLAIPTLENVEDVWGHEPLEEASKTMADLVRLAFTCDITRVASFMQTAAEATTVFYMTGADKGEHQLSHDPAGQDLVNAAVIFNMQCLAYLLEGFKATAEGDGNLLDNLCAFCPSEVGEGLVHSLFDIPMLVVGRAGGALKYPGVHYRSAENQVMAENTSDVLLACAQAVAPAITEVGSGTGHSTTPCAALAPG